MTTAAVENTKATRRAWIGLAVLILPCLIYSMDLTVLNLAVPHLSEALQAGAVQLLWIIDIYGFLVAGCLATMGTLGDRIGRRKLLLIGAAAFAGASLLAAFAPNADLLVGARALLGVAGATIAPSTLALIRNMFRDDGERTFAIGAWGTSYAVGGTIGPVLGGLLLEYFWWGSVFLLAVPAMAVVLVLGPRLIPEYRSPGAGRLDIASAALSLTAVLGVVYGLKEIAQNGITALPVLAIVAGIAVGAVFVNRQRRLPDPFIDLALFRKPAFNAALATNIFGLFVVFGSFLFTAQYLQLMLGLTPLKAALWMLPASVTTIIGSMSAPLIVRLVRPAVVVAGGLGLCGLGFLILTQVDGSLPLLITGVLISSIGLGPVFILTTDLIVGSAPPERAGSAAAISETGAEFGGVFDIAVLGSIGMAVYRGGIADRIPPDVPAAAARAARDTFGGATAAAGDLPGPTGDALLTAARDAFASGYVAVAAISALLALTLAVIAAFFFRKQAAPA